MQDGNSTGGSYGIGHDLTAEPRPTYYFPIAQRPFRAWTVTAVLRPAPLPSRVTCQGSPSNVHQRRMGET